LWTMECNGAPFPPDAPRARSACLKMRMSSETPGANTARGSQHLCDEAGAVDFDRPAAGSPVFNNEVNNDIGDENGAKKLQYVRTEFYGFIVRAPRRLDYVLGPVF
jgi:hypothetical protein